MNTPRHLLQRIRYRARQFRLALLPPRRPAEERALCPPLTPALLALFQQMTPGEQAHSRQVMERLQAAGHQDPDLLAAALLHDVGKSRLALTPFERALVVVARQIAPRAAQRWGQGPAGGWQRAFVVAACHPAWGAGMVAAAGGSPRCVALIASHQQVPDPQDGEALALQQADELE